MLAALALPARSSAAVLYVSPNGQSTSFTCTHLLPCNIHHAINTVAVANDTVIVTPGDYMITTELRIEQSLRVSGQAGQPRPRIIGAIPNDGTTVRVTSPTPSTHVTNLRIEQLTAESDALTAAAGPTLDQIEAVTHDRGSIGIVVSNGSTLRNSLAHARGADSIAVQVLGTLESTNIASTSFLRNVTAIATSPNSVGVQVQSQATCIPEPCRYKPINSVATNVIARGSLFDVRVATANSGHEWASLDISYSNYRPANSGTQNQRATLTAGAGNQSAAPTFQDAAAGNFRQTDESVTIDAGSTTGAFGSDLDYEPRTIGGTPDIGVDEITRPPLCITDHATKFTATEADLVGRVDGGYLSTAAYLEYGLTPEFGMTTTTTTNLSTYYRQIQLRVTGLTTGATYYFRIVATNSKGSCAGETRTFVAAPPPVAKVSNATSITWRSATINGEVNTLGLEADAWFEWGTTPSYGTKIPLGTITGTTSGPVSADLPSLLPNVTYYYRVVATNSQGTSNSPMASFTTLSPPPAISSLQAQSITQSSATVSANVNPHALVTSWYWQWCPASGGECQSSGITTGMTVAGTVTHAISGLDGDTGYVFRLVAENSSGVTTSTDMTFHTLKPPPVVTTTAATAITGEGATFHATVNGYGQPTTYRFQYGTAPDALTSSTTAATLSGSGSASATVTDLEPLTTYWVRVVATNASGTSVAAPVQLTTIEPPPAVSSVATSGRTSKGITVGAQFENFGHDTTWHVEYGRTSSYGMRTADQLLSGATGPTAATASIGGLAQSTRYHARIVALSAGGDTQTTAITFTTAMNPSTGGADYIVGTSAGNLIRGLGGNDRLYGRLGADALYGDGGKDKLYGEGGNDVLYGGAHADSLYGGPGSDKLYGGAGPDVLVGGPGADVMSGGYGNDIIYARDRRGYEKISCGPGIDTVYADKRDRVARDCERVRRR